jgi:secondary thiamine-phosphate synthase enzyme
VAGGRKKYQEGDMTTLAVRTRERTDFIEITRALQEVVDSEEIENGLCHVFVLHTTAGITVNEHAGPSVMEDMKEYIERLVPQQPYFRHAEGNSTAHIKASLTGNSVTIPIEKGRLVLGTWQGVFFCEFDGPRQRQAMVTVMSTGLSG